MFLVALRYVFGTFAFPLADYLLAGLWCSSLQTAILAGATLMLFYLLLRPILRLLAFALNFLTIGLIGIVTDSLLILLTARLFPGHVKLMGMVWAVYAALIINLVRGLTGWMVKRR